MTLISAHRKTREESGRRCFSLFLFQVLLLSGFSGMAQTINLNQFGIEEGLPQSSIYSMVQDRNGSIWVGTMNGVSKYNGLNFENFTRKDGLAENRVTASCLDNNGNIWFGHWSGGISMADLQTNKIATSQPPIIKLVKTINAILCDKQGVLWFATEGQGVLKYDHGNYSVLTHKDGLAADVVSSLMEDKEGAVWIGTDNGISCWKSNKLVSLELSLPTTHIRSLFCDSKGNAWVGTFDQGLFRRDVATREVKSYNTSQGLASNYVKTIFEAESGTIFIGTYGGGVSKFLPQLETKNYTGSLFQTISTMQGLSNDRVLCMLQDREKNIWIGTFLNLNQYFDEQFEIFGENEGLSNTLVWSVLQDRKGNFWLGTEGGIVEFIPDGSSAEMKASAGIKRPARKQTEGNSPVTQTRYRFIRHTGKEGQILNTSSLYEDRNGAIWFSDFGKGITRLDPVTGKTKVYTTENGLPVNEVYCITGDESGNIWIGTNKGGVVKFDLNTEKFRQYTTADGLGSNQVYTIFKDSKNRLWMGSLSGDLTMYDPKNTASGGKLFQTFSEKEGYPGKFTLCITEDNTGNIWLGAMELGLFRYDGHAFKNYSTDNGLSSNTPFLLVCDHSDNLWVGTGLGIDRFSLRNETFKHYEKGDGFLGIEINPNSACKDKSGNLWFGSIIGLVKYNANKERNNLTEPITAIKPPRIFFEETAIPANHELSWSQHHVTFDFVGTSLTNPRRVKYRYMLAGADKDWSHIVKENSVTYPDLQPGKYTFLVRSCNSDGVWNKEPVVYTFLIRPPFWKTTSFYVLFVLVILAAAFVFIRVRERKLLAKNLLLERKVTERTEVISRQKEELEKKNLVITDSIEYAKDIQQSLLPASDEMSAHFKNYFILYQPKDIVSGDFYWVHADQDRILFAVADCTGHGVPGAFMSLMGHNLLKDALTDEGAHTPGKILDALNIHILKTLKQNSGEFSAKYGMDIALIAIDRKKSTLEYAGAHNALLIYRGGECIQLKGDRRSIGSFAKAGQQGFSNQQVSLQKNDMLYLFSDGYTDQVGGPEGKKYFAQPFRELLQSLAALPVNEQEKTLRDTITAWRGNKNQTDDILVVGLRVE